MGLLVGDSVGSLQGSSEYDFLVNTVAHAFVRSMHTRTISVLPGHANADVEGVVTFTAAVKSLFANILLGWR